MLETSQFRQEQFQHFDFMAAQCSSVSQFVLKIWRIFFMIWVFQALEYMVMQPSAIIKFWSLEVLTSPYCRNNSCIKGKICFRQMKMNWFLSETNMNYRYRRRLIVKVSNGAKIRNRYNQVPHLTQDTNGKVTNSQKTPQTRAKRSALSQQVTTEHI